MLFKNFFRRRFFRREIARLRKRREATNMAFDNGLVMIGKHSVVRVLLWYYVGARTGKKIIRWDVIAVFCTIHTAIEYVRKKENRQPNNGVS